MNVIIVSERGVLNTPILVKNDITAQAVFDKIATELLGDDISEVSLHSDNAIDKVNKLLEYNGKQIHWFVDVEVNKYKN
jgi:hypothetical protein